MVTKNKNSPVTAKRFASSENKFAGLVGQ